MKEIFLNCFVVVLIMVFNQDEVKGIGEDTLNLFNCLHEIEVSYPLSETGKVLDDYYYLMERNLQATWYPQISASAQVSWQSDVPHVAIPFSGVTLTSPPLDQYGLSVDLQQKVFDGGLSQNERKRLTKELVNEQLALEARILDVQRIFGRNFYAARMLLVRREVLTLKKGELEKRIIIVENALRDGAAQLDNLAVLQAEMIVINRNLYALLLKYKANINIMESILARKIEDSIVLCSEGMLQINNIKAATIRPEVKRIDGMIEMMRYDKEKVKSVRRPQLYLFSSGGYGKPGLNMLDDSWSSWFRIGGKISWKLWDWKTGARNEQKIVLKQQILHNERFDFERKLNISLVKQQALIDEYFAKQKSNKEILNIRKKIVERAGTALQNGSITMMEYLMKLDDEMETELECRLNAIEMEEALFSYQLLKGKLDE